MAVGYKKGKETLKERPDKVVGTLKRASIARTRKDINQWRTALQQAENVENPKRLLLYNLYDEVTLDAHLTNEIEKRKLSITGADFVLYDQNGEPKNDETVLLKKAWFYQLVEYAMDSRFWGHSLVEATKIDGDGKIAEVALVPRRHVIPEKGLVTVNQGDEKGTPFRENPKYTPWLFEFGKHDDLGLINKCVPHVLFKRFAQSAWSEYCEIFGMPARVAKTNTVDTKNLNRLEEMMENMGTAAWAIIHNDESIEWLETTNADGAVYKGLMELSAAEISKAINGSVIGEASQGGSRSKEEVGLKIQDKISMGDMRWLEGIINEMVLPKLAALGYPVEGLTFEFIREKDLKSQWDIVGGILTHFDVEEEYIIDTFGVPVTGKKEVTVPPVKPTAGFFD